MVSKTNDEKVLDEQTNRNIPTVTINLPNQDSYCSINLPMISLQYIGKQGENVIHSLRNILDKIVPQDVKPKSYLHRNQVISKVSNKR